MLNKAVSKAYLDRFHGTTFFKFGKFPQIGQCQMSPLWGVYTMAQDLVMI